MSVGPNELPHSAALIFIWVFTVYQTTNLKVYSIEMVDLC